MARLSSANLPASLPDSTSIDLARLIARLQQVLDSNDPETELRFRRSSLERERVATNLDYARGLLLKLEQDALNIKAQNRKQEVQMGLVKKRDTLQRLAEKLGELNEFAEAETEDDTSEGEDLLAEDTPSEDIDDQASQSEEISLQEPEPEPEPSTYETESAQPPIPRPDVFPPQDVINSTLRSRHNPREELFANQTATSTGLSTAATESLLDHNRAEQESLTNSLIHMATALKNSSKAFASTLESEKSTLDRATEGLDKNELGLEAASKRMGYLRSMTEGRGWWGRMMMYAWIAGLMIIAILLVFVGPKLRF